VSDAAESEFWQVLERITRATALLEPTPEVVVLTAEIRTLLELDAADASVLATVVAARRADRCRKFMSRDHDFRSEAVRTYLASEGLEFLDSPNPIVGPLRSRMRPR
jgi:predicted nucleic acid-binding protein